jgi:hypothetical protein
MIDWEDILANIIVVCLLPLICVIWIIHKTEMRLNENGKNK